MPTKIPIQKYLKADLFEELGLANLTPEERISFLEGFGNVLQLRLTYRLMQEFSDEQKNHLDELLDEKQDNTAALAKFLTRELPNFQELADEEVAKYKKELIDRFKA